MTQEKKYHFAEERSAGSIRNNVETYAKLQRWFTELQPYFLKEGFIVKNCNPQSKLTAFPFIAYEEAVGEATSFLGDYKNERTSGMYRKYADKLGEIESAPASAPQAADQPSVPSQIAPVIVPRVADAPNPTPGIRAPLSRIIDPLVTAVENAKRVGDPFGHLHLERVFPLSVYQEFIRNLPAQRHYTEMKPKGMRGTDDSSGNLHLPLNRERLEFLVDGQREFWQQVAKEFCSPRLEHALRQVLEPDLSSRFGKEWDKIAIAPQLKLFYQTAHSGAPQIGADSRVIVMQFYLPRDTSNLQFGTALYRQSTGQLKVVKRLPFRPNSGYAFAVTNHSFHGADVPPPTDARLDSLLLTYSLSRRAK